MSTFRRPILQESDTLRELNLLHCGAQSSVLASSGLPRTFDVQIAAGT